MSNLAVNDAGDVLLYDGQAWKPAPLAANDAGDRLVFDGSAWQPLAPLVGAAKGKDPQGRSDALANAFGQGVTFNFGDELTAAVRAAAPGFANWMMRGPGFQRDESIGGTPTPQTVSTAPTFQGRYDEELARQRAQTKADSSAYPVMTTAGNIAGGIASTATALPAWATAAAPTMLGNILKMGATGATLGGVAGFGEGEGVDDRIAKALLGASVGGGVGAATPLVGAVARSAMESTPGRWVSEKVVSRAVRSIAGLLGQAWTPKSLSAAAVDKYAVEREANDLLQSYGLPRNVWDMPHGKQAAAFADFLDRNGIPFERGRANSGSKYFLVRSSPEEGADMVKVRFANHSQTTALHERPDFNVTSDGGGSHSLDEVISALQGWGPKQSTPGLKGAKSLSAAAADGGSNTPATGLLGFADRASNVAESGAVDRIATALQRAKLDPRQVERRLTDLGEQAMIADTDPQFLGLARGAKIMPGATRSWADNVLTARDRGAGSRLVSAFEGGEAPPSSFQLRGEGQAFDQNLRAVGQHAYGMMRDAGLRQTPELIEIESNPIVSRAIDTVLNVERQTRQGTSRAPSSPVEIMHKVKQTIWDMGFDAATARPGPNASYYRDLGIEYMNRLKAANPMLAEADARYAQAASLPEHFDAGRAFLTRGSSEKATDASAPALADLLARADPQQALAARVGATNAARETALEGTRPARALAQRIDESAPVRDKIIQLYGPQQGSRILQRAGSEMQFARTSNDILRGSQTAEKAVDALDLGGTKIRLGPSGASGGIVERLGQLITSMTAPNEAVRDAIGRAMLNPNSEESRRILALAAEVLKRRAAGSPTSASISEIAASLAGRD